MSGFRFRYLGPVLLITLCLVLLCVFTAVSLFHQQAAMTRVLREQISSRRAASDLRGTLNVLIALETHHVEAVSGLHARAQIQLDMIRRLADQSEEQNYSARLDEAFAAYLRQWQSLPPPGSPDHEARVAEATALLETTVLYPCRDLEAYNDGQIEGGVHEHERVLRRLAWGMAGVAGLGGVAGLVLGFGVARSLSRSIRRLHVQLRDAAGKLDPEAAEIVVTEQGDFQGLHSEMDRLTHSIEQMVHELQEREKEVLRAEQLAAVGQLAAGVAHEIRNPLTSIKMLVQASLEDGAELTIEDLRVIESEIRRVEHALRIFLDFARPPKLDRRPVDLTEVVRTVATLLRARAEKQRVQVHLDLPHSGLPATADSERLRQVVLNLCLNSLDAMPTGGHLWIRSYTENSREITLEVADSGPGISKAMMPRLFEPFASGKDTGLGLGLVISKRIIEDHGGSIGAANRTEGGAAFFIHLPTGASHG